MILIMTLFIYAVFCMLTVIIHVLSPMDSVRTPKNFMDALLLTCIFYVVYCKLFYKKGLL
jgi:hypothetical protein